MTELPDRMAAEIKRAWHGDGEAGLHLRRSSSFAILFAGPPGTGKTMAAQALARDLHLDLRRADLSHVRSRYIGETEKALDRIFDAAKDGGEVLLLDEADALLGKRSEVKDSHDRFANIETAYLLQKIEAHHGVVILTTNHRDTIDDAFLRRLRFVVAFPCSVTPDISCTTPTGG